MATPTPLFELHKGKDKPSAGKETADKSAATVPASSAPSVTAAAAPMPAPAAALAPAPTPSGAAPGADLKSTADITEENIQICGSVNTLRTWSQALEAKRIKLRDRKIELENEVKGMNVDLRKFLIGTLAIPLDLVLHNGYETSLTIRLASDVRYKGLQKKLDEKKKEAERIKAEITLLQAKTDPNEKVVAGIQISSLSTGLRSAEKEVQDITAYFAAIDKHFPRNEAIKTELKPMDGEIRKVMQLKRSIEKRITALEALSNPERRAVAP